MDSAVACAHGSRAEDVLDAEAIGHPSTGLTHEQCPGGAVPSIEVRLEPSVEAAAGHPREVHGGTAQDADGARPRRSQQRHRAKAGGGRLGVRWCPRGDDGVLQVLDALGDPNGLAVEVRALPHDGGEELVAERVVDHAHAQDAVPGDADGDGGERLPSCEVRGPVDGVHHPQPTGDLQLLCCGLGRSRRLLSKEAVLRERLPHGCADDLLALAIDLRQEVCRKGLRLHHLRPYLLRYDAAGSASSLRGHGQDLLVAPTGSQRNGCSPARPG
mmetsp:Transcript_74431/g.197713  ORF Transcript_74431/g.197713 Transcript_74431/m.197713 type:complete len:272 (-) Transcript_74431:278-1093(-)